jgi:hypothetical protein
MVQMSVGQNDGLDRRRIDRQRFPVTLPQFLQPLKQTAVDQEPAAVDLEQVLRSSHRSRGAEEGQRDRWLRHDHKNIGSCPVRLGRQTSGTVLTIQ